MIKRHWPVLFAILAVIISIILGIVASQSIDAGVAIAAGVISWMFLFPLAGALIGGWYGWKMRTPLKWLLAPAVYLSVIMYLIVESLIVGASLPLQELHAWLWKRFPASSPGWREKTRKTNRR